MLLKEYTDNLIYVLKQTYGIDVVASRYVKRADISKIGITAATPTNGISAIVYVDDMYESGISVEDAAIRSYKVLCSNVPDFGLDNIHSFSHMKSKLRLLPAGKNSVQYIENCAVTVNKLGMTFFVTVSLLEDLSASINVTKPLLDLWGVQSDEVLYAALANENDSYVIDSIESLINGYTEYPFMYVIRRRSANFGASVLCSESTLFKLIESVGIHKAYVFPSSIHECVVTSADTVPEDYAIGMVRDINASVVDDVDVLDNCVFFVDTVEEKIVRRE